MNHHQLLIANFVLLGLLVLAVFVAVTLYRWGIRQEEKLEVSQAQCTQLLLDLERAKMDFEGLVHRKVKGVFKVPMESVREHILRSSLN